MDTWFKTVVIPYSLVAWHWITWTVSEGVEIAKKTVRGVVDAHTEDIWIFRDRNETPWPVKEYESLSKFVHWKPSENRLYFPDTDSKARVFGDVVIAEIYTEDTRYDLSSFFHNFSWKGETSAPSLYEVILLYCLTNNLIMSKKDLGEFTLEILTTDVKILRKRLDSDILFEDCSCWSSYEDSPSPS